MNIEQTDAYVGIQPAAGLDQSGRWPGIGCPKYLRRSGCGS